MQVVTPELVKGKKVLLRLDIDVPIENGKVVDDFRLIAGMPTLELCLDSASKVIILGHIGRPNGEVVEELSVAPIYDWLANHGFQDEFASGKLKLLENLRFEKGEEEAGIYYAKELASLGNFYVNEAFASHHKSASTTVLPMFLPHCAGLQFTKEVETLTNVRENPKKPLVIIIGGVKVEDKLPAVLAMSKIADYVLVGGKIAGESSVVRHQSSDNILLANLTEDGEDITPETIEKWTPIISSAQMIVWNGPMGKVEDSKNNNSEKIAQLIIESKAESIIGGGDTVGFLDRLGLLDKFGFSASDNEREDATADKPSRFISTGGGAMLKFLETGKLPTIEALK